MQPDVVPYHLHALNERLDGRLALIEDGLELIQSLLVLLDQELELGQQLSRLLEGRDRTLAHELTELGQGFGRGQVNELLLLALLVAEVRAGLRLGVG